MPKKQKVEKILNIILRVIRIVVYIVWFVYLLACTALLVFAALTAPVPLSETDIYMEFHPELVMAIIGLPVSVLNLETALVLLRKYSKVLGILHIVLFAICFVATCVLLMLEIMPKH